MMIESKCGIICSECSAFKEKQCLGCLKSEQQFWGVCPVKQCCMERQVDYCGQCPDFPCELAKQFAYDAQQGDDGKRIQTCQCWRECELKK